MNQKMAKRLRRQIDAVCATLPCPIRKEDKKNMYRLAKKHVKKEGVNP